MPSTAETAPPIAARIQREAAAAARPRSVADVRIGLTYTAVVLDDGGFGLALTFLDGWERGCQAFGERESLIGRPAGALLEWLSSRIPVEAALGLACANALFNRPAPAQLAGDVLEQAGLRESDRVVMVGHFRPIEKRLRARVAELAIFERRRPDPGVQSADEVFSALPQADVALITSTALLNHTLDPILQAAAGCRQVVLLGASTPLAPAAFSDTPVSLLSGVVVREPEAVLQTVSQAGGMSVFKPYVDKVNQLVARD